MENLCTRRLILRLVPHPRHSPSHSPSHSVSLYIISFISSSSLLHLVSCSHLLPPHWPFIHTSLILPLYNLIHSLPLPPPPPCLLLPPSMPLKHASIIISSLTPLIHLLSWLPLLHFLSNPFILILFVLSSLTSFTSFVAALPPSLEKQTWTKSERDSHWKPAHEKTLLIGHCDERPLKPKLFYARIRDDSEYGVGIQKGWHWYFWTLNTSKHQTWWWTWTHSEWDFITSGTS